MWYLLVSVVVRVSGISGLVQVCSWKCSRGLLLLRVSGMVGVLKVADLLFFIVLVWLGVCSFFCEVVVWSLFYSCCLCFVCCCGGCFLGLCVYI